MFSIKPKKVASTPFSEFIRNASSGEKKKVYKTVLTKATERQQELIRRGPGLSESEPQGTVPRLCPSRR